MALYYWKAQGSHNSTAWHGENQMRFLSCCAQGVFMFIRLSCLASPPSVFLPDPHASEQHDTPPAGLCLELPHQLQRTRLRHHIYGDPRNTPHNPHGLHQPGLPLHTLQPRKDAELIARCSHHKASPCWEASSQGGREDVVLWGVWGFQWWIWVCTARPENRGLAINHILISQKKFTFSLVCFSRWSSPSSCSSLHLGEPAFSRSTTLTTTVAPRLSFFWSLLVLPTLSSLPCRLWSLQWVTGGCALSSSPFLPSDWLTMWWVTETEKGAK